MIFYEYHSGKFLKFIKEAGFILLAISAAVLSGIIAALGKPILVLLLVGLVVASFVTFDIKRLYFFGLLVATVLVGLSQLYLPVIKVIKYLVPLIFYGLFFIVLFESYTKNRLLTDFTGKNLILWLLLFGLIILMPYLVNSRLQIGNFIFGFKSYFQILPLMLVTPYLLRYHLKAKYLMYFIAFLSVLQFFAVLHEYFVLVPLRPEGKVAVDIVAGTFGSNFSGGGYNTILVLFEFFILALLLSLWKQKQISSLLLLVLLTPTLFPVFIVEARVSIIYLFFTIIYIMFNNINNNMAKSLIIMIGGAITGVAILFALTIFNPEYGTKIKTPIDLIELTIDRQLADQSERSIQHGTLSRFTVFTFWANENIHKPMTFLFGNGLGESRGENQGLGMAKTLKETKYDGINIGHSAVSAMLWDLGLLGTLLILYLFFNLFRMSRKLEALTKNNNTFQAALHEALSVFVILISISLFHKNFFVYNLQFQTLFYLLAGVLLYLQWDMTIKKVNINDS